MRFINTYLTDFLFLGLSNNEVFIVNVFLKKRHLLCLFVQPGLRRSLVQTSSRYRNMSSDMFAYVFIKNTFIHMDFAQDTGPLNRCDFESWRFEKFTCFFPSGQVVFSNISETKIFSPQAAQTSRAHMRILISQQIIKNSS